MSLGKQTKQNPAACHQLQNRQSLPSRATCSPWEAGLRYENIFKQDLMRREVGLPWLSGRGAPVARNRAGRMGGSGFIINVLLVTL